MEGQAFPGRLREDHFSSLAYGHLAEGTAFSVWYVERIVRTNQEERSGPEDDTLYRAFPCL